MNIEHRTSNIEHRTGKALVEWLAVLAFLAMAVILIFSTTEARGDLTARVYPGYVFQAGQRVTVEQLNRLGVPTITIVGTLDGTNVGLSAGSVNGTMLSADVVDGVTTSFTNASIRVNPSGIRNLQLYTNMFDTSSAIDPGGTTIRWNPDWNFLAISNNLATVRTTLLGIALSRTVTNLLPNQIVLADTLLIQGGPSGTGTAVTVSSAINSISYSNQYAVPAAGSAQSATHGMGTAPQWFRFTLVCIVNDSASAYTAGEEIELYAAQANDDEPAFTVWSDPSGSPSVQIRRNSKMQLNLLKKTTGDKVQVTDAANFNIRVRVQK